MRAGDLLRLTSSSLVAHRLRTLLTILGISVGIASVVLLTSIGEGVHRFVVTEFSQFGTNLVGINPGKATTAGTSIGVFGTARPLTLDDAEALKKLPFARAVVPMVTGNAEVEADNRRRRTTIYGVGPQMPEAFRMELQLGRFLPADEPSAPRAFAVLGSKLRRELFGERSPLGERITIAGSRYRVLGVMASKGTILGFDLDDTVYLPTARAMALFNTQSLFEIDLLYAEHTSVEKVVAAIRQLLESRHGRDDVTITTQQQMLDVLSSVLDVLTFSVAAIGGISLLVGAIGIVTIMTIAVNERTNEIGLLRALGARRSQVLGLFLGEAVVLAMSGGLLGLALGVGVAQLLHLLLAALPVRISLLYILLAESVALLIGLLAGVLPARRAAQLDPVAALRAE
ncbi:MAG: ABC transporter permease [Gammaproteobacteria bacterium]|nr:ABC transporter permease [Gammaproteobacteria bacterium]